MSFPEGKDILLMGNEAAKAAEAFQRSLKKIGHRRTQSIVGDKIITVSETVEKPTISKSTKVTTPPERRNAWGEKPDTTRNQTEEARNEATPEDTSRLYEEVFAPTSDGKTPAQKGKETPEKPKKKVPFKIVESGRYPKLEMEALELLSANEDDDAESSVLTFEEKDTSALSLEARLESIDEKLSMILGLLRALNVATAGPTAARDGIRDAMVGLREELIADIIKEAKEKAAQKMKEEAKQKPKLGNGSVGLTEKVKELTKIVEDESTSGDPEEEEEEEDEEESNPDDDLYSLTM
uniref:Phosphoprotein n=1 Tax=avian metapneumovirus TaxID=38525 RepID=Q91R36_9MONO|nr:phosphoprotein [Avian metapneumovirus]